MPMKFTKSIQTHSNRLLYCITLSHAGSCYTTKIKHWYILNRTHSFCQTKLAANKGVRVSEYEGVIVLGCEFEVCECEGLSVSVCMWVCACEGVIVRVWVKTVWVSERVSECVCVRCVSVWMRVTVCVWVCVRVCVRECVSVAACTVSCYAR